MKKTVIAVKDLGKKYVVYDQPRDRLWGLLGFSKKTRNHWALKDVSFSLQTGQCLGLVGNNGAGKSTLLKLLTGTLRPTTGGLQIDGRLTAILELGAGFHPEFSGRDNLFFGGSLIGLDEATIASLLPSIVAFAELEHALDRPVKTYSSGMVVRLAFALITAVEPQVLIIDEALAVGDQNFQKKCVERIEAFKKNGCTILFCSHSLYHVKQLCDVALWMDQGQAKAFGPTEDVLSAYERFLRDSADSKPSSPAAVLANGSAVLEQSAPAPAAQVLTPATAALAKIESVQINSQDDAEVPLLSSSDLVVDVLAQAPSAEQPHFAVMLEQASGSGITTVATHTDGVQLQQGDDGAWRVRVVFNDIPLFSGDYVISVYLFDATGLVVLDEWLKCKYFKVIYPSVIPGLVRLPHQWF